MNLFILVPHFGQVPFNIFLLRRVLTVRQFCMGLFPRHFTQYPILPLDIFLCDFPLRIVLLFDIYII